jgi:ketosteroid isomerase-like protein
MRQVIAAFVVVCGVFSSPVAHADSVADVVAVENARVQAVERGNPDEIAKFLADDFLSMGGRGAQTNQQYLDGFKSSPHTSKMVHTDVRVRTYGDTAVITGHSNTTRSDRPMPVVTFYTHVYVKRAGEWKLVSMQNTAPAP